MRNRYKILLAAVFFISWSNYSHAGIIHRSASSPAGLAQINLGPGEFTAQTFINLFNGASYPFFDTSTPAALDDDGYPVQNFTGTIAGGFGDFDKTLSTTGPWVLSWPAGRSAFKLVLQSPATLSGAV